MYTYIHACDHTPHTYIYIHGCTYMHACEHHIHIYIVKYVSVEYFLAARREGLDFRESSFGESVVKYVMTTTVPNSFRDRLIR